MKHSLNRFPGLVALTACALFLALYVQAQFVPFAPPQQNPTAQRNAMNLVLNQIRWLQNACGTSGSIVGGGAGMLQQQFQTVCAQYNGFKTTLNPQQANAGANQIAELDSGLDIIQEAFGDYQTAVANGQSTFSAYNNLQQVLSQAMRVWTDQYRQTCSQLHVGW
jgi:hypothetical protein